MFSAFKRTIVRNTHTHSLSLTRDQLLTRVYPFSPKYLSCERDKDSVPSLFTHASHREGIVSSDRALELLRSAASGSYPPGHSKGPLKFNLEVISGLPTKDQLRTIESYLPHGGLSSFVKGEAPTTTDQVLSQAKRDIDSFKWPVVVDWVGGKAAVGDVDGVNDILEHLRKKRDGEVGEAEEHKPKGWFS
jgi:hypothetical protein